MSTRGLLQKRPALIPTLAIVAVASLTVVFWQDITAWFSGEALPSRAQGSQTTAQAGPFGLTASLVPDPPREKKNTLMLSVTERGAPVNGARVAVTYRMPAMGSMQEMRGEAEVVEAGSDGQYEARFDLPMGGNWSLRVGVEAGQRSAEATFNMTVGSRGLTAIDQSGARSTQPSSASLAVTFQFDDVSLGHLRSALAAYDEARGLLAADRTDGLSGHAKAAQSALEAASQDLREPPAEVVQSLSMASAAAGKLEVANPLPSARRSFAELSMHMVALAAADPRLVDGLHIFECPMTEGYPKWFQPSPRRENPYMGQQMLECGVATDWTGEAPPKPHDHSHEGEGAIAYYTCSMHPSVKQQTEGTCPICSMDLIPVTREEVDTGTIFVDEIRRQRIGVRTAPAVLRRLTRKIRAVGQVRYDETRLHDVNLRMGGWVQNLEVDETGQEVRRGQTLFTLYSPELYAAQLEYLTAVRRQGEGSSNTFANLLRAARQRLHLLGMAESQIKELERRDEAREQVPILAPSSGFAVEKRVVAGARVEAGALVYRIADLSAVWVDAEVYESDLPHVSVGQTASIELPYVDKTLEGRIDYIYPTLEGQTRTGRMRLVLDNQDFELKPDMYANVEIKVDLGERLVVPDSAVIYTGPRRLVFVDHGEGRLKPQLVELGVHADGFYEVTAGIQAGNVVVTSANFLIAAESRIRSAAEYWGGADESQ